MWLVPLAHLESFVLQDALDGSILARGGELGLKDDAEGSVSYNLALCVLHISSLTRNAILDLFANNLYSGEVSRRCIRCQGC
jgi:hypothetical protein